MLPLPVGREAGPGVATPPYVRHRPECTLLYQLVEQYYPSFKAHLAVHDEALPGYIDREFDAYLKCGRLGAETAGEPDAISRCVRAKQSLAGEGDTGRAGQGRLACHDRGSGGAHSGRTPCRDELGATPEAGFQYRH